MKSGLLNPVAGPRLGLMLLGAGVFFAHVAHSTFVNFETAPVHPIALSPDGHTLAVCNLPDGRVELFEVSSGVPVASGNVPVGIDPVSLRFRGTNELWVVNFISSSVNIIDLSRRRVVAVLSTLAGPSDVVFAGTPQRAFVSCSRSNVVMVFDPVTRRAAASIAINGDRPKAMAASPDGSKVFVAIFESGNASTILGGKRDVFASAQPTVVDATNSPYAGQNPPPNSGNSFNPPRNPNLTEPSPPVSHIVKKNTAGRWLDGNLADWTEFVSGTNAALSGRVPGWDMPDRDMAVIDTATLDVSYLCRLMNICMDVAVNPVSGRIAVVGTDALNDLRFEPNLQSVFLRVNLALVDPFAQTNTIKDLNPHLDYVARRVPQSERNKSIGDPRGVVWSADGARCYVTGMGSQNLVVLDAEGNRLQAPPVQLQEGPTGLALDEARQRIYVLNRFSASLSVVSLTSSTVVTNVALLDPTPVAIKTGRRLLYDTHSNSGLGQVACASCHVDARFDRLAWDLGDPSAGLITNTFGTFHPMKGPKVTQTFQGLNPEGPLHWRADREGIAQFNQTFVNLLGRDTEPSPSDDDDFAAFLRTIFFPPNPLRNFDNTLATNLPLPGHFAYDTGLRAPGNQPLPNGNARRGGEVIFRTHCSFCHNPGSGLGNPFGDSVVSPTQLGSSNVFKIAQLRSLADKVGFEMTRAESRAGFGFSHDGRVDTLTRLLGDGFGSVTNLQDAADLTAFLLSFSGSEIRFVGFEGGEDIESNLDGPAALGFQTLLTNSAASDCLQAMIELAGSQFPRDRFDIHPPPRLELIARGSDGTHARGWRYFDGYFQSDRDEELLSAAGLFNLASPTNELLLMLVGEGSANRIATDRDADGARDLTESEFGFDPGNSQSYPTNLPLLLFTPDVYSLYVRLDAGHAYSNNFMAYGIANYGTPGEDYEMPPGVLRFSLAGDVPVGAAIDSATGEFTWTPSPLQRNQQYRIAVRARYATPPAMTETIVMQLTVNGPVVLDPPRVDPGLHRTFIKLCTSDGRLFHLQYSDNITSPSPIWIDLGPLPEDTEVIDLTWPPPPLRVYRAAFYP